MAISRRDIPRGAGADVRATSVGINADPVSYLGTALSLARSLGMAALAGFGILVLLPALAAQAGIAF